MRDFEDSSEEHQIKEVYAFYGVAMYYSQCLEKSLCILLSIGCEDLNYVTRQEYDDALESLTMKTFGQLLRQIKKTIPLKKGLLKDLDRALDKRNWLAHRYFYDSAVDFNSRDGRLFMVLDLGLLGNLFEKVDAQITSLNMKLSQQLGLTEELLEERANALLPGLYSDKYVR